MTRSRSSRHVIGCVLAASALLVTACSSSSGSSSSSSSTSSSSPSSSSSTGSAASSAGGATGAAPASGSSSGATSGAALNCSTSTEGGSSTTAATPSAPKGSKANLKLSTDLVTPGVPYNDAIVGGLPSAVSSGTNGDVGVTIYPNNELYKTPVLALAAAARGQVDLVVTNAQNASSSIPAMAAPGMAFLADNIDDYYKIFTPGTPFFTEANTEAEKAGLEIVPVPASSPGTGGVIFKTKTPATSLDALKGQKVRVPGGGLLADELSALGAQPVTLTTTDTAPAIQAGTVSAAIGTASFAAGALKGLVGGYLDTGTFQVGPYFLFASKASWGKLSKADQDGIASSASTLVNTWLKQISTAQACAEQGLQKAGLWVSKISDSESKTLETQFRGSIWPQLQKTDANAYNALVQTRQQLGLS